MKKRMLTLVSCLALLGVTAPVLAACANKEQQHDDKEDEGEGDKKVAVTSITLNAENAKVYLGKTFQIVATVAPQDATDKKVTYTSSDATIASVSETGLVTGLVAGNAVITVTSVSDPTVTKALNVVVTDDDSFELDVTQLKEPAFMSTVAQHTSKLDKVEEIQTKGNKTEKNTFYENADGGVDVYKVGSQNPFEFVVGALSINEELEETIIQNIHSKVKLEINGDEGYRVLEGEELESYVTITDDNTKFQFTERAENGFFRLTISADETKYASVEATCEPVVFEFQVIDAYNVYQFKDLALFDTTGRDEWKGIQEELGVDPKDVHGLVLHTDIEIENEDLPAGFKLSEEDVEEAADSSYASFSNWLADYADQSKEDGTPYGEVTVEEGKSWLKDSLKDWETIFERSTDEDTNFRFEGNYFGIDYSKVKQVYDFSSDLVDHSYEKLAGSMTDFWRDGSHSQFFGLNVSSNGYLGEVSFKNLSIKGNGKYSSDAKYMGGMMTFKTDNTAFSASNVLTFDTFLTALSQNLNRGEGVDYGSMSFDRFKSVDSYNSMFYLYGTENNTITNSSCFNAGGAILLLDEVRASTIPSHAGVTPHVVVENTFMESFINQSTPWFVVHDAAALVSTLEVIGGEASYINALAKKHNGNSFIKKTDDNSNVINLIAIDISGADALGFNPAEKPNSRMPHGSVEIRNTLKDGAYDTTHKFDMSYVDVTDSNAKYQPYMQMVAGKDRAFIIDNSAGSSSMVAGMQGMIVEGASYLESAVMTVINSDGEAVKLAPTQENPFNLVPVQEGEKPLQFDVDPYKNFATYLNAQTTDGIPEEAAGLLVENKIVSDLETAQYVVSVLNQQGYKLRITAPEEYQANLVKGDYTSLYFQAVKDYSFLGVLAGTSPVNAD